MWFLFGIQLFLVLLFLIMGWALRKKKAYWLLSGFATRPKEEQQQLIENGYLQKTGALLLLTGTGLLLLLPLTFTSFKYSIEIQFGFMLVFLLGGLIYLSKYEVEKKRKRSYIISSTLFVVVNSFVVVLMFFGYQDYDLITQKDSFEITGIYGDEWKINDIQKIEMLEKMPEVTWKQNGCGLSTMDKGYFKVKGYGSSLLFIQKGSSPILYIELKNKKIFINSASSDNTQKWYDEITAKFNQHNKENSPATL
ncbi:DUF3784 domain-containing protein [Bacillus sp. 1NLA3E]|uniref:DUF3784 domain-containing protein n=1 Tax=Bacillus sp. 1NLA3E TaxID=666686 RepID=UPI000247EA67|nr:DUF3784 domain-containing protein [Bacillus sp. 1NLA3E]AGK52419.1 hypothetical protein B1NLA3E_03215 [Bacillus sp. 1NLA3E]